jgi:hypothetical protein
MKAQWVDGKYGFSYLTLGRGSTMQVVVGWDSTRPKDIQDPNGYKVSFEGSVLVKRFQSSPEAKAAGIKFAKRVLTAALDALPPSYDPHDGAPTCIKCGELAHHPPTGDCPQE